MDKTIITHPSHLPIRSTNKHLILLIEDESFQIEIYEKVIKEAGFEIESLQWGKEGLKRLEEIKAKKKKRPDLILLDIVLPDISGMAILEKAKTDPELRDIPFFIFTNYSSPGLKEMGRDLGAEKHFNKTTITSLQLIKFIQDWFKKEQK